MPHPSVGPARAALADLIRSDPAAVLRLARRVVDDLAAKVKKHQANADRLRRAGRHGNVSQSRTMTVRYGKELIAARALEAYLAACARADSGTSIDDILDGLLGRPEPDGDDGETHRPAQA